MRLLTTSLKTLCALALIAASLPATAQVTETVAKHHMIAAANPHAAQAGLDISGGDVGTQRQGRRHQGQDGKCHNK